MGIQKLFPECGWYYRRREEDRNTSSQLLSTGYKLHCSVIDDRFGNTQGAVKLDLNGEYFRPVQSYEVVELILPVCVTYDYVQLLEKQHCESCEPIRKLIGIVAMIGHYSTVTLFAKFLG